MNSSNEKVVLVSGAARGQGRAHALRAAADGAHVVGFDICEPFEHAGVPAATESDLMETQRLVEVAGRHAYFVKGDARDSDFLRNLADETRERFGRVDSLVVNHGVWTVEKSAWETTDESWQESIDILLTGAWKVVKAFVPLMIDGGRGGSIVLTSSVNAFQPQPSAVAYCAAKGGVTMLMKVLAHELGPHGIRVNTVNPGGIDTPMLTGGNIERSIRFQPHYFGAGAKTVLGEGLIQPSAIADAAAWLISDQAAHVTGVALPVDDGRLVW